MTWIENIERWRQLPAEEKLLRRWKSIPRDVGQSMAFERDTRPDRATRFIETMRVILTYSEIAPLLGLQNSK